MKKALFCLFSFLTIMLSAQNTLCGIVLNNKDRKPVESATVYISGTTQSTSTDSQGHFIIKIATIQCKLVVTHVAFNLSQTSIEKIGSENRIICLKEKENQLSGISVVGNSMRNSIIKEFKAGFFGEDRWGKNALMKNDSVLYFSRRIDTIVRKAQPIDFKTQQKYGWSKDSTTIVSFLNVLSAKTKLPLIIELPLLGYDVYLDLVNFDLTSNTGWTDCSYLTYSRFVPNIKKSSQQAKFERNRQAVYYNSGMHFCKSLFDNKLKENGYLIAYKYKKDNVSQTQTQFTDISPYIRHTESNDIKIIGLKDKELYVYYFCKYDGKPIDLTKTSYDSASKKNVWQEWDIENASSLIFKSDTCTIRSNGTIPDTNILFDGEMATKRGGALLPYDYLPSN